MGFPWKIKSATNIFKVLHRQYTKLHGNEINSTWPFDAVKTTVDFVISPCSFLFCSTPKKQKSEKKNRESPFSWFFVEALPSLKLTYHPKRKQSSSNHPYSGAISQFQGGFNVYFYILLPCFLLGGLKIMNFLRFPKVSILVKRWDTVILGDVSWWRWFQQVKDSTFLESCGVAVGGPWRWKAIGKMVGRRAGSTN